ncbi:MAG: hypothetical protein AB9921_07510 [Erysipelotrichaceae bacterium]|jgi:hypothetical protein
MRKHLGLLSKSALVFTLPAFMVYDPNGMWIWLTSVLVIGVLYFILSRHRKEVRAVVDKVERMPDGTYLVTWGYINPTSEPVKVQNGESCLLVKGGTALLLSREIPKHFATGRHRNVIQTIILGETSVEWIIGSQRTSSRDFASIRYESM